MSAADTVKDVVRIATTAGLAKDVIDLLDKKASLLAEQVAALEQENTTLLRENRNLKLENENLKTQLQNARPKGDELAQATRDILLCYFKNAGEITARQIAQHFQMELSVAEYHLDLLWKRKFIAGCGRIVIGGFGDGRGDNSSIYAITSAGRTYCIENGLVT